MEDIHAFSNLASPEVIHFKHDLGDGNYALLTVVEAPKGVFGSFSSSLIFPPKDHTFRALDVPGAVAMVEAAFAKEYPDHVCGARCFKHWERMAAPYEQTSTDKRKVN